jgi:YD repeat-containing protein
MRGRIHVCILVLTLAAAATAGAAEQHPNVARGFDPKTVYQFHDYDTVNLFNGNLVIAIPLGLRYPNDAGTNWGLTLTYNSKLWDYVERNYYNPQHTPPEFYYTEPVPSVHTNAGLGWSVSMGRLISPDDPQDTGGQQGEWLYESPDGARHKLGPRYSTETAPAPGAPLSATVPYYSHDGSYLRLRPGAAGALLLDFPDGSVHTFTTTQARGGWRLVEQSDAFGNKLTIKYDDPAYPDSWVITDKFGRKVIVAFGTTTGNPQLNLHRVLSSITFPAPRAEGTTTDRTLVYTFHYDTAVTIRRGCTARIPVEKVNVVVPFLDKVSISDADGDGQPTTFEFTYEKTAYVNCESGTITSMKVPTGGTIAWTHDRTFLVASADCEVNAYSRSCGVKSRTLSGAGPDQQWAYETIIPASPTCSSCTTNNTPCESPGPYVVQGVEQYCVPTVTRPSLSTVVTSGSGRRTEHFFSTIPANGAASAACYNTDGLEYGLPYTRASSVKLYDDVDDTKDVNGYLSSREYRQETDAQTGQQVWKADRDTYVAYAWPAPLSADKQGVEIGRRTVFVTDASRYVQTLRGDYDGYGHYRVEETTSDFPGSVKTVRRTTYNPGSDAAGLVTGTGTGRPLLFAPGGKWILNTYGSQRVTRGTQVAETLFCFDATNGFLTRQRIIRSLTGTPSAAPESADVVAQFLMDAPESAGVIETDGNLRGERWGLATNSAAVGTNACDSTQTVEYTLFHGYDKGVRNYTASGTFAGSPRETEQFLTLHLSLDPIGLPITSTDSAGVVTAYGYDILGRLKRVRTGYVAPGTVHGGTTTYTYHDAVPSIDIVQTAPSNEGDPKTTIEFDSFGRVVKERVASWNGVSSYESVRSTSYDSGGRKKFVSEPGIGAPSVKGTSYEYDVHDRPVKITGPDGAVTTIAYAGTREVTRTTRIGRVLQGLTVVQSDSKTIETYDGAGQLTSVTEPANPDGSNATTQYTYDVGGRLATVTAGGQTRTFVHDAAGFLLQETHPELKVPTTYGWYDARGHAATRGGSAPLSFLYDAAGRLRTVTDASTTPPRLLQEFVYGSATRNNRTYGGAGRLLRSIRHNWFDGFDYAVTTWYAYDAASRLTTKDTEVQERGGLRTFSQTITPNSLDLPVAQTYPTCAGCGTLPSRTAVGLSYRYGSLSAVSGFAKDLSWHPGGLLGTVTHVRADQTSLVTDEQLPDSSSAGRIGSIAFKNARSCSLITQQPKDVTITNGTATLTIAVSGTGVVVTWYRGVRGDTGTPVGTGASLTLTGLAGTAQFWARITEPGSDCQDDSVTVLARSCTVPRILSTPETRIVRPGTTVTITAIVEGAETTYQWSRNGQDIANATGPTLSATTPGTYKLKVSGCGGADEKVLLTIAESVECRMAMDWLPPPAIMAFTPDEVVTVSAQARPCESNCRVERRENGVVVETFDWAGTNAVFHFEWTRNGVSMPGATQGPRSELSFPVYDKSRVVLRTWATCASGANSETIEVVTLGSVYGECPQPVITLDQAVIDLDRPSASRTVTATVDWPTTTLQWYAGDRGNTLRPVNSDPGRANQLTLTGPMAVWVRATTDCGETLDSPTIIAKSSSCTPVQFRQPLPSVSSKAGQPVTMFPDVVAEPAPSAFDWWMKAETGSDLPLGSTPSLTVRPTKTTSYRVRVGNGCHWSESTLATIHVTSCDDIELTQPLPALIDAGATTSLHVTARAAQGSLTYQWYEGESGDVSRPLTSVSAKTDTLQTQPPITTKYWVRVTAATCAVDSVTVTVTVCRVPAIVGAQPNVVSSVPSVPHYLAFKVDADEPEYRWFQGASPGTGVTDDPAAIPVYGRVNMVRVAPAVTTQYWLKILSSCPSGRKVKLAGPVLVSVCPAIVTQPAAETLVMPGTSAQLSVEASRGDRFEWYAGVPGYPSGQPLSTSRVFTTPPVNANTSFWARVYSGECYRDSDVANVKLCTSPTISWLNVINSVKAGQSQTLTVNVNVSSGVRLIWYAADPATPSTWSVVAGPTTNTGLPIAPLTTKIYKVRVESTTTSCRAETTSATVRVCIPTITASPASQLLDKTTNPSASVALSVTATGDGLTYQWYEGTAPDLTKPVSGQTARIFNASPSVTTTYWVRVSGPCSASADSASATVTVCVPPSATGPSSVEATAGAPLSLTVNATGTGLHYQWYQGALGVTTTKVGTDSATLPVNVSVTTDYWVRVTGSCGSVDRAARVSIPASITTPPADRYITKGTTAAFSVAASGTWLSYQWHQVVNGASTAIANATAASYTTPALTANAQYWVRVMSGTAKTDLPVVNAYICAGKAISVSQPSQVSGSNVTLSVASAADESYAWYEGETGNVSASILRGQTATVIVQPTATTRYWLRITRATCYADSEVTVTVCIPKIVTSPQSHSITYPDTRTLSVTASGTAPLTYQWYYGNSGVKTNPIGGQTSSTLTVSPSVTTSYWVEVRSGSNATCTAASATATVSVCRVPAIASTLQPSVIHDTDTIQLSVTTTGDVSGYQWYERSPAGVDTLAGTSATLVVRPVTTKSYWVRVSGPCGTATSNVALQSVRPVITTQPSDTSVCAGANAPLAVSATGDSATLTYTWYRGPVGNVSQPLGTGPTLQIPVTAATTVWCNVVSGNAQTPTRLANLSVEPGPPISSIYSNWAYGSCYSLWVDVPEEYLETVSYQWYQGNIGEISSPVGSSRAIMVCPSQTTKYWVRVRCGTGCWTDAGATLTIP